MTRKKFLADPTKKAQEMLAEMLEEDTISGVARQLGVNKGLVPYVMKGGYSPTMLNALNLPILPKKTITACPECGKIHTMQRTCSTKRRHRVRHRKIAEVENREQLAALTELAKWNGFESWSALCRHMAKMWLTTDRGRISFK